MLNRNHNYLWVRQPQFAGVFCWPVKGHSPKDGAEGHCRACTHIPRHLVLAGFLANRWHLVSCSELLLLLWGSFATWTSGQSARKWRSRSGVHAWVTGVLSTHLSFQLSGDRRGWCALQLLARWLPSLPGLTSPNSQYVLGSSLETLPLESLIWREGSQR